MGMLLVCCVHAANSMNSSTWDSIDYTWAASCALRTEDDEELEAVASLLGDVVAYRAVGASHLELFAGECLSGGAPDL